MRALVIVSCLSWIALGCQGVDVPVVEDAGTPDAFARDGGTDAFVPHDAWIGLDAFVADDAFSAPDAFVADDAFSAPDGFSAPDAFVDPDAYVCAGMICGAACIDTTSTVDHCGSCTNACTTATANAHATCDASTCGYACDPGYVASGTDCVLDVLDRRPDFDFVVPLGDYRAFRGAISSFSYDRYTFTLTGPTRVQIDLFATVRAELTSTQIASGDATPPSPYSYVSPSPASWAIDDLTDPSEPAIARLCWSQDGFSCPNAAQQDMQYLRRSPSSDGMWDGDAVLPAGNYQIRVARGSYSGPSYYDRLYYYGEITITPM